MTFSEITNYIINRFDADELVNTIALNDKEIVDTKKENIFPLVSLFYDGTTPDDDNKLYQFTIYVLQQRDARKETQPSKLMTDTNWIDNLNECESIAMRFINYVRRMELENIAIDTISDLEPLSEYGGANLDGYRFEVTISIPNTGFCS